MYTSLIRLTSKINILLQLVDKYSSNLNFNQRYSFIWTSTSISQIQRASMEANKELQTFNHMNSHYRHCKLPSKWQDHTSSNKTLSNVNKYRSMTQKKARAKILSEGQDNYQSRTIKRTTLGEKRITIQTHPLEGWHLALLEVPFCKNLE